MIIFPAEILAEIARQLDLGTLKSFRESSKTFASIGAYFLLPTVIFHNYYESFERLEEISHHKLISKGVRTLHCVTTPLINNEKLSSERFAAEYQRHYSGQASEVNIEHDFVNYNIAYDKHLEFVNSNRGLQILDRVVKRFPGLQKIIVSHDVRWHSGRTRVTWKPKFLGFFVFPHLMSRRDESHVFLSSMALSASSNLTKLVSLHCQTLNWRFIVQPSHAFSELQNAFSSLTSLKLEISNDIVHACYGERTDISEQKKLLRKGGFAEFLSSLERLSTLEILFETHVHHIGEAGWPAELGWILAPGHKWGCLRKLALSNIYSSESALINTLTLHKDTLTYIRLKDYAFTAGSWVTCLSEIRDKLDLQDASLSETLSTLGDEPAELFYVSPLENELNSFLTKQDGPSFPPQILSDLLQDTTSLSNSIRFRLNRPFMLNIEPSYHFDPNREFSHHPLMNLYQ